MKVGIIMGSDSDLKIMEQAAAVLEELGVEVEMDVMSAHRTPEKVLDYSRSAYTRGVKVIIAGAGGAAHLAGVVAAVSPLPVIGVPIKSSNSIDGWDSVLSMLQMPSGVPVATVALDGAKNAGILAAQMIATGDEALLGRIIAYKEAMKEKVEKASQKVRRGY
ncbi:MAG: 5-(carboxyamino)imidazole ribonucleotide mutase [Flavobacteriales bacterium]|jgi:5-(carboxyamino)imidazole ribonucleotide mutase|nr:5-(carboxyamino)imidazole ribonucleotide mutase [Flavobacteriales bacterium]MBQ1969309.1 5-(carboxyamino)imidazole ribonucleotide mutase [Flavobacteriales bacterium]MBQ5815173.1 5-(carboxyamino)imidazole ribonucleotide mutase [Flavobacteriales bacterium]MBR4402903.1 5-(carboxyamino)imidazole ribonucleotide mutase [Flavobacteriales bacterium]